MHLTSKEAFEISLGSEKFKSRLASALEIAQGKILESAKEGKLFAYLNMSDLIPGLNPTNLHPEHLDLKNQVLAVLESRGFKVDYPSLRDDFVVSWRKG